MLEHLLDSSYEPLIENDPGLTPVDKAAPAQTVDAQSNTADWLTRLGAKSEDEIVTPMEQCCCMSPPHCHSLGHGGRVGYKVLLS